MSTVEATGWQRLQQDVRKAGARIGELERARRPASMLVEAALYDLAFRLGVVL